MYVVEQRTLSYCMNSVEAKYTLPTHTEISHTASMTIQFNSIHRSFLQPSRIESPLREGFVPLS